MAAWPSVGARGDWPRLALVDMGRAKIDDLPERNAVGLQIAIHQGALARGRTRCSVGRRSGSAHREFRMALVDWIRKSLAPGLPKAP